MKIPHNQLERKLAAGLAPIYLVAGDEPLLVADALDQIRAAARGAGFETRELHVVDQGFRWDDLLAGAGNLSLFAARRIVELRLPAPRPGDLGARTLRALADREDPDRLLIVAVGARLDRAAASSQWAKALESAGAYVEVRSIDRAALPRWIRDRAVRHGLELTQTAADLLADRVEGNLLAAEQELIKLALDQGSGKVDDARVLEAVADSARFDVFRLIDAVLEPDATRAIRVLGGLRAEGVHPVLVSWALGRELALLAALKFAASRGERLEAVLGRHRVWPSRRPMLERALRRIGWVDLKALLKQAVEVDGIVKGAPGMPPWDAVTRLVVAMLETGRRGRSTRAA